jgi:hypothetical protein
MPEEADNATARPYNQRWPAGTIEVRGTKIPVFVDGTDSPTWYATVGDKEVTGNSKENLRTRAMTETKKAAAKVSVPFTAIRYPWRDKDGQAVPGEATGIHAGTGKVLIHWPRSGKREQTDGGRYQNEMYFRPLSDEEAAEVIRLHEARREAQEAFAEYTKPRLIALKDAVIAETDRQAREMAD